MLITEAYRREQESLHAKGNYGVVSIGYAGLVTEIVNKLQVQHLLDYGCGANTNLLKHIKPDHKLKYQAYDPGVEEFSSAPVPAEMVCCIDVLEHIEPECLEDVLDDLKRVTETVGLFTVCTAPALKTLKDGRNAHLIQQPLEWWLPKFMERFDLQTAQVTGPNAFHVIVYAKQRAIENSQGHKLA